LYNVPELSAYFQFLYDATLMYTVEYIVTNLLYIFD